MEKNTLLSSSVKGILIFTFILLTGILLVFAGGPSKNNYILTLSPSPSQTLLPSLSTEKILNVTDNNEFAGWKIYSDQANGYEFKYPGNMDVVNGDIRISVAVEDTTYKILPEKCPTRTFEGFSDELDGKKNTIGNIQYCEYATGEGVGDTLIEYSIYTAAKNKSLYAISTSAALKNCENFCKTDDLIKCRKDPDIISCMAENNTKLNLAKKIITTFKFIN